MPPGAFGYSIGGIHELQPVPDDLLLALNPQWHVVVGSPEHPKAIAETTARVQHVRALLPDCCIGDACVSRRRASRWCCIRTTGRR